VQRKQGGSCMAITRKEFLKLGTLGLVGGASLALSSAVGAKKPPTKTVLIQGFKFKPANITIKRGTKVRWINKDGTQHTATANNGRSFDSGRLGKGQSYTHTFKSAGKKPYHCEIHSHMKGRITVRR
jgi:plastocyanin